MPCGRCTAWACSTASTSEPTAVADAALKHPSAGVRRNAVQVLPRDAKSVAALARCRPARRRRCPGSPGGPAGPGRSCPPSDAAAERLPRPCADPRQRRRSLAARRRHRRRRQQRASASCTAVSSRRTSAQRQAARRAHRHRRRALSPAADRPTPSATIARGLPNADPPIGRRRSSAAWPRAGRASKPPQLDAELEQTLGAVCSTSCRRPRKGQLVTLATRWGSKAFEKHAAEIAAALLAHVER